MHHRFWYKVCRIYYTRYLDINCLYWHATRLTSARLHIAKLTLKKPTSKVCCRIRTRTFFIKGDDKLGVRLKLKPYDIHTQSYNVIKVHFGIQQSRVKGVSYNSTEASEFIELKVLNALTKVYRASQKNGYTLLDINSMDTDIKIQLRCIRFRHT